MKYSWFTGHMEKTRKLLLSNLKHVDLVFYLIDARAPFSSFNPLINQIINHKALVIVLTKIDLCDKSRLANWEKFFQLKNYLVAKINLTTFKNRQNIVKVVDKLCKKKQQKAQKKGLRFQPLKSMVVGVPNVGKSTFINYLTKKNLLLTANRPGLTKKIRWVKVDKNLFLLDTPGILWPKFNSFQIARNLAIINSAKITNLLKQELMVETLNYLKKHYLKTMQKFFPKLEVNSSYSQWLKMLKLKYGLLEQDNIIDKFFSELRVGKLGLFTFETPSDFE